MTTPPTAKTPPIELAQVRTAGDAAAWMRDCCSQYAADADTAPSETHAQALRKTALTLHVLARAVVDECRDDITAASMLTRMARGYRKSHGADLGEQAADYVDYQLACGHLADTLGEVGTRLTHATAPERARRASMEASRLATSRERDL